MTEITEQFLRFRRVLLKMSGEALMGEGEFGHDPSVLKRLAAEVRRVRFELPEGVERIAFHPMGLRGSRQDPFPPYARQALIVSPFA